MTKGLDRVLPGLEEWAKAHPPTEPKREKKGHAAPPGSGPAGQSCGTCAHCEGQVRPSGRVFYKCGLRRADWSHGLATDVRKKDEACELWKQGVAMFRGSDKVEPLEDGQAEEPTPFDEKVRALGELSTVCCVCGELISGPEPTEGSRISHGLCQECKAEALRGLEEGGNRGK